jgi:DNA-binding NtrC family response regulator
MDGVDVLRAARERVPMPKALVITAHGDVDSAVSALRLAAFDFIRKPFGVEEVLTSVKTAQKLGMSRQMLSRWLAEPTSH